MVDVKLKLKDRVERLEKQLKYFSLFVLFIFLILIIGGVVDNYYTNKIAMIDVELDGAQNDAINAIIDVVEDLAMAVQGLALVQGGYAEIEWGNCTDAIQPLKEETIREEYENSNL